MLGRRRATVASLSWSTPSMTIKCRYAEIECKSCGHEQGHHVDLPEEYSDSDLRDALDYQTQPCEECGDVNWAPLGAPEERAAS